MSSSQAGNITPSQINKTSTLTPDVILVAALLYMMASDGSLSHEEISVLQQSIGEDDQVIQFARAYIKNNKIDAFINESLKVLDKSSKLFILLNVCDCIYSDGLAEKAELSLFVKILIGFGFSEKYFKPYSEFIEFKNNKSILGEYIPNELGNHKQNPHKVLGSLLVYMMSSDGNVSSQEIGQISSILGKFNGLQEYCTSHVSKIKLGDYVKEVTPLLNEQQRLYITINVCDSMMSDGNASEDEMSLFNSVLKSFEISDHSFKPYFDYIKAKNTKPYVKNTSESKQGLIFENSIKSEKSNLNSTKKNQSNNSLIVSNNLSSEDEDGQLIQRTMNDNLENAKQGFKTVENIQNIQENSKTNNAIKISNATNSSMNLGIKNTNHSTTNVQQVNEGENSSNLLKVAIEGTSQSIVKVKIDENTENIQNISLDKSSNNIQKVNGDKNLVNKQKLLRDQESNNPQKVNTDLVSENIQNINSNKESLNIQTLDSSDTNQNFVKLQSDIDSDEDVLIESSSISLKNQNIKPPIIETNFQEIDVDLNPNYHPIKTTRDNTEENVQSIDSSAINTKFDSDRSDFEANKVLIHEDNESLQNLKEAQVKEIGENYQKLQSESINKNSNKEPSEGFKEANRNQELNLENDKKFKTSLSGLGSSSPKSNNNNDENKFEINSSEANLSKKTGNTLTLPAVTIGILSNHEVNKIPIKSRIEKLNDDIDVLSERLGAIEKKSSPRSKLQPIVGITIATKTNLDPTSSSSNLTIEKNHSPISTGDIDFKKFQNNSNFFDIESTQGVESVEPLHLNLYSTDQDISGQDRVNKLIQKAHFINQEILQIQKVNSNLNLTKTSERNTSQQPFSDSLKKVSPIPSQIDAKAIDIILNVVKVLSVSIFLFTATQFTSGGCDQVECIWRHVEAPLNEKFQQNIYEDRIYLMTQMG